MVPRSVCGAPALGARARRLGGRRRVGRLRECWSAGLWLGAARLGRAVPSLVEPLLVQLLGELQPALCRRRRGAAGQPACAVPQCGLSGSLDRGVRRDARLAASGRVAPGERSHPPDNDCPGARRRTSGDLGTVAHSRSPSRRQWRHAPACVDLLSRLAPRPARGGPDGAAERHGARCADGTSAEPACLRHAHAGGGEDCPWSCTCLRKTRSGHAGTTCHQCGTKRDQRSRAHGIGVAFEVRADLAASDLRSGGDVKRISAPELCSASRAIEHDTTAGVGTGWRRPAGSAPADACGATPEPPASTSAFRGSPRSCGHADAASGSGNRASRRTPGPRESA